MFQRLRKVGRERDVTNSAGSGASTKARGSPPSRIPRKPPDPRFVVVEQLVRDPETGQQELVAYYNFRAVDITVEGRADADHAPVGRGDSRRQQPDCRLQTVGVVRGVSVPGEPVQQLPGRLVLRVLQLGEHGRRRPSTRTSSSSSGSTTSSRTRCSTPST